MDQELPADHPMRSILFHSFARLLMKRGFLETAEEYLDRSLEIVRKALGPMHPNPAELLITKGELSFEAGGCEAAREHFQKAPTTPRQPLPSGAWPMPAGSRAATIRLPRTRRGPRR